MIPLDRTSVLNYTLREPLGVVGDHRSLELAGAADDYCARAGARGGEHDRRQAVGARARERARDAAARGGGRVPARRPQRRHRRAREPARRSSTTRGWRRSAFTGSEMTGARDRGAGRCAARAPSRSSSAARARTSSSPTPPRRRRGGRRSPASSRPAARPASPARARSSIARSTTSCSSACRAARAGDPSSATRWTAATADGPGRERAAAPAGRADGRGRRDEAARASSPAAARATVGRSRAGSSTGPRSSTASATTTPIPQNEVFGPVLTVLPFETRTRRSRSRTTRRFGLAAGVWTRDVARAHRVARGAAGRHGLDQHLPRDHVQLALRRLQGERHRPRERHGGDRRLPADEERLVRALATRSRTPS